MLPDGSRVKSSDLDALTLVKRMEARVETMGQNSADLLTPSARAPFGSTPTSLHRTCGQGP